MWNDFKGKCICYVCVAQSCLTVCKPTDCSPPGSSVHGIFQARILEGVAMPSSRGSSWPRNQTCVSCIGRQILYHYATREAPYLLSEVEWSEIAQSCPTLCDPMDYSLPGSSVHGIFQVRVLEWGAISFSRGSSQPRDQTRVSRIVGRCFTVWAIREAHRNEKTSSLLWGNGKTLLINMRNSINMKAGFNRDSWK